MKKLFFKTLFLALVVTTACDTLDQSPQQSLDPGQVFVNEQGANNALIGAYNDVETTAEDAVLFAELAADGANHTGSFPTWNEIDNNNILVDNATISGVWNDAYEALNTINGVIVNVPGIEDESFSQAEKDAIVGQALVLRAWVYHFLIQWWGSPDLGVPLVLEPTSSVGDETKIPRNSTQEVYNQIRSDLEQAISLMSGTDSGGSAPGSAFVNETAARGLLARVLLDGADRGFYSDGYTAAVSAADAIINSGDFSLASSYESIFLQQSPESLWEMVFSSEDANGLSFFARPNGQGGRFEYGPTAFLVAAYEAGDERGSVNVRDQDLSGTPFAQTILGKYLDTNGADNIVMIRYAEILLIRAEANLKANPGAAARTAALDIVDQIRARSGASAVDRTTDNQTDDEVLDTIIFERRLEFVTEGLRWHDLVRTNKIETELGVTDRNTRWPITQRELEVNPSLTQNPGY